MITETLRVTLIGVGIAAVLGPAGTFLITQMQTKRKSLSYALGPVTGILNISDSTLRQRVTLQVDGQIVRDATLVQIEIFNDGGLPILPSDFVQPLMIDFGTSTNVLSAECGTGDSQTISTFLHLSKHHISFEPMLLNPKDRVEVSVLLQQWSNHVKVAGHITGVASIKTSKKQKDVYEKMMSYILWSLSIAGWLVLEDIWTRDWLITIVTDVIWFAVSLFISAWIVSSIQEAKESVR